MCIKNKNKSPFCYPPPQHCNLMICTHVKSQTIENTENKETDRNRERHYSKSRGKDARREIIFECECRHYPSIVSVCIFVYNNLKMLMSFPHQNIFSFSFTCQDSLVCVSVCSVLTAARVPSILRATVRAVEQLYLLWGEFGIRVIS